MARTYLNNLRRFAAATWRIFWPVFRQILGWMFILLGLLGIVLPVLQGVLFLVIGIALVGKRNILIRRSRVALKRFLRRWAAIPTPVIGALGRMALRAQQLFSRQLLHAHIRFETWWRRRFPRQTVEPHKLVDGERYKSASERVYTE